MIKLKRWSLGLMVLLYVVAGVNHFVHPRLYLSIMPGYLPFHEELVIITGICEIVFGLLLLPPQTRRPAAWMIMILLVAMFPANIQMAINFYRNRTEGFWITILRLPLQPLLIWWSWQFAKKD